jgi:hypothetical protein
MRKWATRFHSAFTGRSREQPSRPFKDMMLEVLGEISKYTEHLLGDEVLYFLCRIREIALIEPLCRLSLP